MDHIFGPAADAFGLAEGQVRVMIHCGSGRLGATRALPPGHPDLPADLRDAGQPVLI